MCAAQSGRTHSTRGRYVVRLETLIIQGVLQITRQQQQVKWTSMFFGLGAPVFASIIVIVIGIDFLGFSVR